MDIETKIALGFLFTFIAGLFIGWLVTWQKYHHEEEKRKAVSDAINHEKIKNLTKTEWENFVDILSRLNKTADEYRIVYDDCVYSMTSSEEPPTEEETA